MKTKEKKKSYAPPTVHRVKMERAIGTTENCKTGSPSVSGMNGGISGDCDPGVIGSPPPGPCLNAGS